MAQTQSFSYPSQDGIHQCYAQTWLPPEGVAPRGVVQIVHGVAEYIGRYAPFASWLAGRGFIVTGEDHLGHGMTARADSSFGCFPPERGWEIVAEDVHALRELQQGAYPGLPYFMLGHSMGSFLTRTCLIRHPGGLAGVILSGTGQEKAALVAAGKAMASMVCRLRGPHAYNDLVSSLCLGSYNRAFRPNRTSADWVCGDEAVVDAYLADPFCTIPLSVGLFRDMLGGIQFIGDPRNLASMDKDTPIYLFSGDRDPVGSFGKGVTAVRDLFLDAGCTHVAMRLYPGGRHEMLNETNHEEIWADTLAWMEEYL